MTLPSNTLHIITGMRPKRRLHSVSSKGKMILVDQAFLQAFGRICLVVASIFFLFCSILGAMNTSAEKSIATLESQSYELLTSNLQLKSEKNTLGSVEKIGDRAKEYGLYPQEKWQHRIL